MNLLRIFVLILSLVLSLFAKDESLEKISVQLKWKHQFQFAGFYMAQEKGFYKEAGLDVAFYEYERSDDILKNVMSQERNFGVGYSSVIYDKTQDNDIILLSALLQSSPTVLASLDSSPIQSIRDFKDKKIMIAKSGTHTMALVSMLHSFGLSFDDMVRFDPDEDVEKLIQKEVDIISGFRSNQIYMLKQKGAKIKIWDPKDFGFDFYDDILFTSQKELQEHPQRTKDFLLATLKGYRYAYENIDETIALIMKKYNTQNKSKKDLLFEAQTLKKLAFDKEGNFGKINPARIERLLDIYNLFAQIEKKIEIEEFVYRYDEGLYLSRKEREYLENKKVITMCIDPEWMPFEALIDSEYVGMSADYYKLLEQKLPVSFEPLPVKSWSESYEMAKKRKCDILSLAMATPQREKYFRFTQPYLNIPLVMATKTDAPFISDISALHGKKVAIPSGYAFLELLREKYPNLDIVEVQTLDEGLKKVVEGKIYGYIGTLATIGYSFQKNYTGELKISGKFDGSWDLGIGVRNDDKMLFDILQKALSSIDRAQKQNILNSWLSISYEQSIDYKFLLKLVAAFLVLIGLMALFYLRERRLKKSVIVNQKLLQAIINNIPMSYFLQR